MRTALKYWPPAATLATVFVFAAVAYWRVVTIPTPLDSPFWQVESVPIVFPNFEPDIVASDDFRSSDANTIAARPLFVAGRKASATVIPRPTPEKNNDSEIAAAMRMVGYIKRGERSYAVIQLAQDGRTHVVQDGDVVEGITVRNVEPDGVVLDIDGQTKSVKLFDLSLP